MTAALVCFNLLVNATISMLASIALVLGGCRLLRIERGRLRALVLSAPLFKAAYEVVRGIPEHAFFWAKLSGATQELGSFQLGFGVTWPVIPVIDFSLGALWHGRTYAQSAADVLASALGKRVGFYAPMALGALLALFVLVGVCRHGYGAWRGVRMRRAIMRSARLLETRALGTQSVRIFVSERWQGVPFAAGVLRPWLCMPEETLRALDAEEREAVVAHELAHLLHHDLLLLSCTQLFADALSFVPGARWLVRKIRAECEIAADQRAIQTTSRVALASALVRVAELVRGRADAAAAELSFLRPGRALSERVGILLAPVDRAEVRSRFTALSRWALALIVISAVLRAAWLGNP